MLKPLTRAIAVALSVLMLTACGGGGDEDEADPRQRNPPQVCKAQPGACI